MQPATDHGNSTVRHRWPAYPAYRASGVAFPREVPRDWDIKRLKFCVGLANEKASANSVESDYVGLENIESWTGRLIEGQGAATDDSTGNLFREGDVLFGKLRPYLAKALLAQSDGVCSGELLILRPRLLKAPFLLYYVLSDAFVKIVDSSTYGAKMPRANWRFIGSMPLPLPRPDEQQAIVTFLDRETARINEMIAKKERLIALLKEKRTALISHAVTKGLNPAAPMKPSGIDWLGDLPAHWEVKRLKFAVGKIGSGKTPKGGAEVYVSEGVMLLRSQNVYDDGLRLDDVVFIDEETDAEMASTCVESDDVLLNITGASIGRCTMVPPGTPQANVNQHVCIIRPKRIRSPFLHAVLCSKGIKDWIRAEENGTSREGLNFRQVGTIALPVPPDGEQEAITEALSEGTSRIDGLIRKVENVIDRLQEYRSALISAAVTGKIDVREAG